MKGHMRERSGSWELRVFAGRDAVTGRKRYLTRTVRGGKREAQRALAALIVEAGENGAPRRETFAELVEEWFAHAEPDFSPKTAAETRRILDRTVIPRLGDPTGGQAAAERPRCAVRRAADDCGRADRPLAPATVRRIHGIIHRALGQGVRWGWVAKNPAALCRHSVARVRGRRQNRGWPTWPSQRRNHPQRLLALLDGA
jgi:integrase